MLRDNLAGLIEPMVDHVRVHPLGGHPKERQIGGCSRSTELAIVALKRSWRQIFRWKTGRRAENGKWPGVEVITVAPDSRAVGTAQHRRHRTIDPQCLRKSPLRRGGIFALTENVASPVHAEPRQLFQRWFSRNRQDHFLKALIQKRQHQTHVSRDYRSVREYVGLAEHALRCEV
jgi:hypothetical protein